MGNLNLTLHVDWQEVRMGETFMKTILASVTFALLFTATV